MAEVIVDSYPVLEETLNRYVSDSLFNLHLGEDPLSWLQISTQDPARLPSWTRSYPQQGDSLPAIQRDGTIGATPNLDAAGVPEAAYKRFSARGGEKLSLEERKSIAKWMAYEAQARGFPPELPVMAALVETGGTLRNLTNGDKDSVGFFQIRVSIHGTKAVETPKAQLQWFLYNATRSPLGRTGRRQGWTRELFQTKIAEARGKPNSGELALWLGRWCQDIERSAYPDKYQHRYDEAIKLIYE